MKKLTALTIAAGLALGASATDYTWTGADNNYWTNKLNWSGNAVPAAGKDNRVIFDTPGTVYVRNNGMSSIPRTVIVLQGDVVWGGEYPYTSHGLSGSNPLVFDIRVAVNKRRQMAVSTMLHIKGDNLNARLAP